VIAEAIDLLARPGEEGGDEVVDHEVVVVRPDPSSVS